MVRILVVDNEQAIRCLLRDMLEPEGYEVVEAEHGAEGLRRYQYGPTDLVIIDMQMPVMDGLELLKELRRTCPRIKVMAISGAWSTLEVARTFTPYTLEKPFALDAVRAMVSKALQEGTCAKTP